MRIRAVVAASVAAGVLATGCGPSSAPDRAVVELLDAGARNLAAEPFIHIQGSIAYAGRVYVVDMSLSPGAPTAADGTLAIDDTSAEVRVVSGNAFERGTAVADSLDTVGARIVGADWVLLHDPLWLKALREIVDERRFRANFVDNEAGLSVTAGTYGGTPAEIIANGRERVIVSAGSKPAVLSVVRVGSVSGSRTGDVMVDLSAAVAAPEASAPARFLDFRSPQTLPALYVRNGSVAVGPCTYYLCHVSVAVSNQNGNYPPPLRASVTFVFETAHGSIQFDSCEAPIPWVPGAAAQVVGCQVADKGWIDNQGAYFVHPILNNPAWTP